MSAICSIACACVGRHCPLVQYDATTSRMSFRLASPPCSLGTCGRRSGRLIQNLVDFSQQRLGKARLGEESVTPGCKRPLSVAPIRMGSQDDHWYVPGHSSSHRQDELHTVSHARKPNARDDDVYGRHDRHGLHGGRGNERRHAVIPQEQDIHLAVVAGGLYQQDTWMQGESVRSRSCCQPTAWAGIAGRFSHSSNVRSLGWRDNCPLVQYGRRRASRGWSPGRSRAVRTS